MEVAAADMRVDAQVGGRGVEHAVVHAQQRFLDARKPRLVGAEEKLRLRVDEASPRAVVELQVAAARGVNLLDERQVGGDDIVFEKRVAFVRGVGRLAVHGHDELLDELRRRGDRQLRCGALVLEGLDEAEVLDERVLASERDLPRQVGVVDLGSLVVKRQAVLGRGVADALECPHEVKMPGRAAELAVGDEAQAGLLLLRNEVGDALVLNCLQRFGVDRARAEVFARLLQPRGAKEASDDVVSIRSIVHCHCLPFGWMFARARLGASFIRHLMFWLSPRLCRCEV